MLEATRTKAGREMCDISCKSSGKGRVRSSNISAVTLRRKKSVYDNGSSKNVEKLIVATNTHTRA